jgi:hypothetical protein
MHVTLKHVHFSHPRSLSSLHRINDNSNLSLMYTVFFVHLVNSIDRTRLEYCCTVFGSCKTRLRFWREVQGFLDQTPLIEGKTVNENKADIIGVSRVDVDFVEQYPSFVCYYLPKSCQTTPSKTQLENFFRVRCEHQTKLLSSFQKRREGESLALPPPSMLST